MVRLERTLGASYNVMLRINCWVRLVSIVTCVSTVVADTSTNFPPRLSKCHCEDPWSTLGGWVLLFRGLCPRLVHPSGRSDRCQTDLWWLRSSMEHAFHKRRGNILWSIGTEIIRAAKRERRILRYRERRISQNPVGEMGKMIVGT